MFGDMRIPYAKSVRRDMYVHECASSYLRYLEENECWGTNDDLFEEVQEELRMRDREDSHHGDEFSDY